MEVQVSTHDVELDLLLSVKPVAEPAQRVERCFHRERIPLPLVRDEAGASTFIEI